MPKDVSQLRSLLDGISYHHKFQPKLAKRVQLLDALLNKGVVFIVFPPWLTSYESS